MSPWAAPLRVGAVVLDWAGTTVDHGSRAPVTAVTRLFAAHGLTLSEADARGPMGVAKREHIRMLLEVPSVAVAWREATGRDPLETDVVDLYAEFQDVQVIAIAEHSDVIEGVPEAIAALRARGIAIGSTTGYFRPAAVAAAALAAPQGYAPDVLVAVDDVPAGRPAPWMLTRAMEALRVYPPSAVIKVGDTPVDMAEGRNAGTWAIGVTETGNELGLSAPVLAALVPAERAARASAADDRLRTAGAHLTIRSVAELPDAVHTVEKWLARGERP